MRVKPTIPTQAHSRVPFVKENRTALRSRRVGGNRLPQPVSALGGTKSIYYALLQGSHTVTTLRLLLFPLTFSNINHRQRVHELRRGYKLRGAIFVLDEFEDENDLHGDIRFSVIERAVGKSLEVNIVSAPANTSQGWIAYMQRDGAGVIYGIKDLELGRGRDVFFFWMSE